MLGVSEPVGAFQVFPPRHSCGEKTIMVQFLLRQSILFLLGIFLVCSSVGCRAIYSDNSNSDVENAFRKDTTFDWVGTARPKDDDVEYFGVSNKAKAIEQHMGGK